MRSIKKDSTDQSVVIRIIDSTDGTPENAVEYDTTGIDLWYRREGATKTSITEAALAALDSAHLDGGIELIGDGYYRLDPPDAAFATGSNGMMIGGTVTDMIVMGTYVSLVDYDPQDTVRLGLTALPNAAADAIGGLPISDLGGLDLDAILEDTNNLQTNQSAWATAVGFSTHSAADVKTAIEAGGSSIATILADTNELQGDWVNDGRLDLILDIIAADTTTDIPALIGDVPTVAEFDARTLPTADYITVADILDTAVEGAYTPREIMRVMAAVMGGVSSGAGTNTMVFRDLNDTKDRVTATLTEDGDRITVVINAS